mgnify:CR=1 FL=1
MNKVYVLVIEYYIYWDNEHTTKTEVFSDKQSAMNYLQMLKPQSLNDICETTGYTIEELKQYHDEGEYVWCFDINDDDYFHVEVDEYGYDRMYIVEKPIMTFNM